MKTILGTGQLGKALMDLLLLKNPANRIQIVNRSGKVPFDIPQDVVVTAADVTDKREVERIVRQSEIVFSCTDAPYQHWHRFYPATADALANAMSNSEARLVFADNMYSYGNVKGEPMIETMPHNATTKKGIVRKKVIEKFLNSDARSRITVVKASDFVGPRIHKGLFGTDFLNKLCQSKTTYFFGDLNAVHSFTFINDFAQAMINIGNAEDAYSQIWHAPNAPAISVNQWITTFEDKVQKKLKVHTASKTMIGIIGLFSPLLREMKELSYQFEHPYIVSNQKYIARFGNHATSIETIIAETLSWYQSK